MIAWMLYTLLAGLLVSAAAAAVQWLAQLARRPVRWIWVGAFAFVLALSATAPFRRVPSPAKLPVAAPALSITPAPRDAGWLGWRHAIAAAADQMRRGVSEPAQMILLAGRQGVPASATRYVAVIWVLLSASLALVFAGVHLRFVRARRRWPVADMHGVQVRVSPQVGPVVIGVRTPEIVVPWWAFGRPDDEQRLIVAHEREHVRAGDSWLLAAACAAVALLPWNVGLWFMLSKLRLAIELDCDARVLHGGVTARTYGSLLIDIAENSPGLRSGALALGVDSSHLHQRILAMKPLTPRFAAARATAIGLLGASALFAACQPALPTDAEVANLDAKSAEKAARDLAMVKGKDSVVFLVDGKVASAESAHSIERYKIEGVDVRRDSANHVVQIALRTKKPAGADSGTNATFHIRSDVVRIDSTKPTVTVVALKAARDSAESSPSAGRGREGRSGGDGNTARRRLTGDTVMIDGSASFSGIYFIDGVRADAAAVQALGRTMIQSVEVLKGPAAVAEYGPEAAHGVITVVTKKSAGKP